MQDRYAGDVGDFGKYDLLRALFSDLPADRPLGVIWYLVPNETNERTRNDGRYTEYLHRPGEFRRCDPSLFDQLGELLLRRTRSVAAVQARSILPSGTRFFSEALVLRGIEANTPEGRRARAQHREAWVSRALAAMEGCSAIFLDPDNGLEAASIGAHAAKGPKYVTYDEVAKCVARSEIAGRR